MRLVKLAGLDYPVLGSQILSIHCFDKPADFELAHHVVINLQAPVLHSLLRRLLAWDGILLGGQDGWSGHLLIEWQLLGAREQALRRVYVLHADIRVV